MIYESNALKQDAQYNKKKSKDTIYVHNYIIKSNHNLLFLFLFAATQCSCVAFFTVCILVPPITRYKPFPFLSKLILIITDQCMYIPHTHVCSKMLLWVLHYNIILCDLLGKILDLFPQAWVLRKTIHATVAIIKC